MKKDYLVEVCAANIQSAMAAQKGGAGRIELCDNLYEGGTTPSFSMIKKVRSLLKIELNVMIRPRGGDFCYSPEEFEIMMNDIQICRELRVDGVVLGILLPDGTVDAKRCQTLVEQAWPMSTTFHRAIDVCRDPFEALETISGLEMDRILTAGQQNQVTEGLELIGEMVKRAGDRIIIMPGSGIRPANIKSIRDATGAREFHLTGRKLFESPMVCRKDHIFMGGLPEIPENDFYVTDPEVIRQVVQQLHS